MWTAHRYYLTVLSRLELKVPILLIRSLGHCEQPDTGTIIFLSRLTKFIPLCKIGTTAGGQFLQA